MTRRLLVVLLGFAHGLDLPPTQQPKGMARRTFFLGAAGALLPAASAARDLNRNVQGQIYTMDEDEPFRAALSQIGNLLDRLGVEGAANVKRVEPEPGPPIERSYTVGLKGNSDRLQPCPGDSMCLSSTRVQTGDSKFPGYVYFDQKGDAVGRLIELLYKSRDAQLLTATGNFFNGAGVYVLAEIEDQDAVHDVEFQFLPGVLESVVDVRIVQRNGDIKKENRPRQRVILDAIANRLDWLPLSPSSSILVAENSDRKDIFDASKTEMLARDKFEEKMEQADADLEAAMVLERKRIDDLKREVRSLLDALAKQEDARMNEYLELRSRTSATREEYEDGVAQRIGGYANTGRYAGSQTIRLGNSFAGLINSQDDTLAKVYANAGGSTSSILPDQSNIRSK